MTSAPEFCDSNAPEDKKYRGYFMTINNPADDTLAQHASETYAVWQREEGASGTPHLQVQLCFSSSIAFSTLKKLYPRANISVTRNLKKAIAYCQKPEGRLAGPWERGEPPKQGQRSDIEHACDIIKANLGTRRPLQQCAANLPSTYVKYHKGLRSWANEMVEDRTTVPEVHVLFGQTETGKSRTARELCPQAWVWNPAMKDWFDGYLGHKEAIFEEYRGQLPYSQFLSLLDRYTVEVPVKGGMVSFVATKIVITSSCRPQDWYPNQNEKKDSINQLLRRITSITEKYYLAEEQNPRQETQEQNAPEAQISPQAQTDL